MRERAGRRSPLTRRRHVPAPGRDGQIFGWRNGAPTPLAISPQLAEVGVYHYKARAYHPAPHSGTLGRFMQPDPIGYADGPNLYAYAGNDPVNRIDPTGLAGEGDEIIVTGRRSDGGIASGGGHKRTAIGGTPLSSRIRPEFDSTAVDEVIVTAQRRGDSYLDGLISTGFSPCIGGCLPIIDFYLDENGLTIVARRADGDVPVYGFRRAPGAINLELQELCGATVSVLAGTAGGIIGAGVAPLAGAVGGAIAGFKAGQAISRNTGDVGAGVLLGGAVGLVGGTLGFVKNTVSPIGRISGAVGGGYIGYELGRVAAIAICGTR